MSVLYSALALAFLLTMLDDVLPKGTARAVLIYVLGVALVYAFTALSQGVQWNWRMAIIDALILGPAAAFLTVVFAHLTYWIAALGTSPRRR